MIRFNYISALLVLLSFSCADRSALEMEIFETSAAGSQLTRIAQTDRVVDAASITLYPDSIFQTITGFGGAFTESSAYLLNQLSGEKRKQILEAYFGENGAKYSLTRTHINSCDFSLSNYSYAPQSGDTLLQNFSIDEDRDDLISMILEAQKISKEGFKIIASPWTAPIWMKDNNDWKGGKLLPEYYPTWANFFSKYINAYAKEGIPIWAVTVENEPLGNGSQWESMHFSPEETADFIKNHLAPTFKNDSLDVNILAYDQNRGKDLDEWAEVLLSDSALNESLYGTAIHWYSSTVDWYPQSLNYVHNLAPEKHIIHTEGCIDAEIPHWKEDAWYWKNDATDWGYDWAPEEDKKDHPKYVPVHRYAQDMIGCMNNWVEGWVDWNMVLNDKGGPNWAKNWCIAPVIVKPELDEVYFTPLYYTMSHFSRFIRPEAKRIGFSCTDASLQITAARNIDGSIVVVLLNTSEAKKSISIELLGQKGQFEIDANALQTIVIQNPI
jgi:glucosylceramidase